MSNITYSIGGVSFNAVPEIMKDLSSIGVNSEATIGKAVIHSTGVAVETIVLSGKYMTQSVKEQIDSIFDAVKETGQPVIFNDGITERDVLIRSFEITPIVGVTEGYGFRMELVAV